GFAIEAAKAVIEYAKQAMQLSQLLAITNNDNIRSISLLKKLGFEFEHVEQQYDNGRTLELYTLQL
ncbi:GNAT family N-acetyltransferase, partial [Vibrio parahaemolyticus]|nr:GNAT family N-acetyltransferase [Vibrio parahaemolyticus]